MIKIFRTFEHSNVTKCEFDHARHQDLEYLGFISGENIVRLEAVADVGEFLIGNLVSSAMHRFETATHIFDFRAVPIDRNVVQPEKPLAHNEGYFFVCGNVYGPR